MKNINGPDPKRETKANENATNENGDLLNTQEKGTVEDGQQINDNRSEVENGINKNDFGGEDAEKQLVTNNPDEKEEIF